MTQTDDTSVAEFLEAGHALDEVALDAMLLTLTGVGPAPVSADEVAAALACTPRHTRLLARWLDALAANDRITLQGNTITRMRPIRASAIERAWRDIDTSTPYPNFIRRTLAHLPELLADRMTVHSLMFDTSSQVAVANPDIAVAQQIYRDNPSSRLVNRAAGSYVRSHLADRSERGHILEIGAGTGATTEAILDGLADAELCPHYLFTDVGVDFLRTARVHFGKAVDVAVLDIHQPLSSQLPTSSEPFDVVVAANVLHNSSDITSTLAEIAALLAPDGVLVLIETSWERPQLLASAEFLMSPRPTLAQDHSPRDARRLTGAMFPSKSQWIAALELVGLPAREITPDPNHPLATIGQFAYLAARAETA